jgi:PAS domain S-box-containing protein
MGPYAFSQAFLCGFFAFAALSSFVLWWGTRREATLLTLSIVCTIGAVQSYAALLVASATTVVDAQFAIQLRTIGGSLNVAALAWLFAGIASVRARAYLWIVTTILLSPIALITLGIPVLGGRIISIERIPLPWGELFTALERTPTSPWASIVYLAVASTIVFNLVCARRFMTQDRTGGLMLMVAAVGSVVPLVSGVMTDMLGVRLPFFGSVGVVATTVVIALQMVDNRRRHARLITAERRFRAIFDQTFQFIGLLDVSGTLLEMNQTALVFAGAQHDDVVGKAFWETPWWTHSPELQARVRRAVASASRGEVIRFEATHRAADGQLQHMDFSLKPVHDATGAVVLLIPESRNIEDRVVAEDTKRKLEQRLAHAQKMEALGQLAGGAAHDFNNLLTVIAGHADMLRAEANTAGGRFELEQIRLAAEQAASLTGQLLAFSRQSVIEPKLVNPNAIVASTETLLRRTLGERIELRVRPGSDLRPVRVDPRQLGRALLNIGLNAKDAMPSGGHLTIETHNVASGEFVPGLDAGANQQHYVMISVADTGVGMSEETRARLFEPFFTTKSAGKGTGLGMSVVDGIVRQSGGHILIDSRPGQGSVFRIYLPSVSEAAATETGPAELIAPRSGNERILLVEDDMAVRSMTQSLLERQGYSVASAGSGEEALNLAALHRDRIDLVLTDVGMAGMSGPQLVERLRSNSGSLPVLFMSGHPPDQMPTLGIDAKDDILRKPFTPSALAIAVRAALDRVRGEQAGSV